MRRRKCSRFLTRWLQKSRTFGVQDTCRISWTSATCASPIFRCKIPRDLRQEHINCLVKVQGVVTRRSPVYPQLKECTYNCMQCGYQSLPFAQTGTTETKPSSCVGCQGNGPFKLNTEKTVYRNYQKMMLQETPGTVAPGRVPRQREVIVTADLIDRARPGERSWSSASISTARHPCARCRRRQRWGGLPGLLHVHRGELYHEARRCV